MKTSIIPNFIGKRWLKISLRSIHILGIAGVFATVLTTVISTDEQYLYWAIAIVSGLGLLAIEALSNLIWFVQIRALVIYIKFCLLISLYFSPDYAWHSLVTIILLSGFISHAPSSVRYFSFVHGRKITSINDVKG